MRLLLINTFEIDGGAAIATNRLHKGLRSIGVDSRLLVQSKKTDDMTVIGSKTKIGKYIARLRKHLDRLFVWSYDNKGRGLFSPANLYDGLAAKIDKINPDIVHLFWVAGGFLKIETIKKIQRPIIWTLHDMWPFTGGCHYDEECGKFIDSCGGCPLLQSINNNDLSRKIWLRKQKSWENVPIVVVATSHWLANMARASSLFKNKRIEVLPNGLDTDKFKPLDKAAARSKYKFPIDKKLILFSAFDAVSDKRKGNQFLMQALAKLSQDGWCDIAELVIIGSSKPETPPDFGMKVHYMGKFHDEISQVLLYSAADVVVAPSMQENLSNTVMESLACGTPVVAFNIGGMPDMIEHKENGFLATPFDFISLADGISWVLSDDEKRQKLSNRARSLVVENFKLDVVAKQYVALYNDVLQSFGGIR
jgi:glycosyltransferase involved in cell wall biosynthesis